MKKKLLCLLLALVCLGLLVFSALEVLVLTQARDHVEGQPGAMVILGAQLREDGPSLFLRRRLERALDYLADHPDTLVVVSGGQGENEPDTEAAGMEKFLRDKGFTGTILQEDTSRNTKENLQNSKEVLAGAGYDIQEGVILVSNDFHLARARMLGERFGYKTYTLAAPSDHLGHKIYNYIREPVGLVKSFFLDR